MEFPDMDWDWFTTITGTISSLSLITLAVFPPAVPIAAPLAAITGALFSYGTNKGGKSKGLSPLDVKRVLVEQKTETVEVTLDQKEKPDA